MPPNGRKGPHTEKNEAKRSQHGENVAKGPHIVEKILYFTGGGGEGWQSA